MAEVVDQAQNARGQLVIRWKELPSLVLLLKLPAYSICLGVKQPNGYTEPLLHAWRLREKKKVINSVKKPPGNAFIVGAMFRFAVVHFIPEITERLSRFNIIKYP